MTDSLESILARVAELDEKATKGPWKTLSAKIVSPFPYADVVTTAHEDVAESVHEPNAALISEYRTLCPRLAREVTALREQIRLMDKHLTQILRGDDDCDG